MRSFTVMAITGAAMLLFGGLGGCKAKIDGGASGPSFGAPVLDDQDAANQIKASLDAARYEEDDTSHSPCSEDFEVQSVRVTDKAIDGSHAKVHATAVIKSKFDGPIAEGSSVNGCFHVQGGFSPNQIVNLDNTYAFSLWNSGWKLDGT